MVNKKLIIGVSLAALVGLVPLCHRLYERHKNQSRKKQVEQKVIEVNYNLNHARFILEEYCKEKGEPPAELKQIVPLIESRHIKGNILNDPFGEGNLSYKLLYDDIYPIGFVLWSFGPDKDNDGTSKEYDLKNGLISDGDISIWGDCVLKSRRDFIKSFRIAKDIFTKEQKKKYDYALVKLKEAVSDNHLEDDIEAYTMWAELAFTEKERYYEFRNDADWLDPWRAMLGVYKKAAEDYPNNEFFKNKIRDIEEIINKAGIKYVEEQIEVKYKESTVEQLVEDASLLVEGRINKYGEVKLSSLRPMRETIPDKLPGSNFSIECLDANSNMLSKNSWGRYEETVFSFIIPCPGGTSSVVFKRKNEVLKEIIKTKHAPKVKAVFVGRSKERYRIRWESEDADSETLYHNISALEYYSERYPLATNTKEKSILLPTHFNNGRCRIDISVSDGLNERMYSCRFLIEKRHERISREYYKTGELRYEWGYEGDTLEGISKNYYKNGMVKKELEYKCSRLKSVKKYPENEKVEPISK